MGTQDGAALPRKVEPPLNSKELSTQDGPGLERALLAEGWPAGCSTQGCLPKGAPHSWGFPEPSHGRLCAACLQQSRKCWQETCTSLSTRGKEWFSPHSDLGSRGALCEWAMLQPCPSRWPNGERSCLLWRTRGTAHSDQVHREGLVIPILPGGESLRSCLEPDLLQSLQANLSTFMGDGKLRAASLMPRLRPD